ncbi:MAG: signal peptidase I [Proteobacteria bacterium]|nr:signal peptidase I [Pseudomonadota bacterium]MBU1610775.1 signal peptidase I [Pseudomonadota bacterium]
MAYKSKLQEWIEAIFIAALLALFIRSFVIQAFKITSGSMLETLQIGDHLLVSRFAYDIKVPFTNVILFSTGDPQRGDILVFEYPEDPSKDFIKRLIGLPGDTVEIVNKQVLVNGEALDEPYKQHLDPLIKQFPEIRDNLKPVTVPEGHYLMLGDNRDDSRDSRFWGFVSREAIIGKALILYWSWDSQNMNVRWDRLLNIIE